MKWHRSAVLGVCASIVIACASVARAGTAYTLDAGSVVDGQLDLQTDYPALYSGFSVSSYLGANRFYSAGVTGQNTVTANVEAGFIWGGATGHATLAQVTDYRKFDEAIGEVDRHATWVGMMIGGRQAGASPGDWQTGIAPATDLRSGAFASKWSGTAYATGFSAFGDSIMHAYNAYFGVANVINSSWGANPTASPDPGGMNFYAIAIDGFVRQNPQTAFVVSAGNYGSGSGTTVGWPATGYNGIVVGALASTGNNSAISYDSIADFSSRGAGNYADSTGKSVAAVRPLVDIVAPGTNLVSAYYGGQTGGNGASLTGSTNTNTGNNNYSTGLAGTSFSAPIVAGGISLLDSASIARGLGSNSRDTRVIKAVIMNSADKISGWNNGQSTVNNVITTTQGLDYTLGAGRLNLSRAYDQYLSGTQDVPGNAGGTVSAVGWDYGLLSAVGQSNSYLFNQALKGGTTMDVTLDWLRDRSVDATALTASDNSMAQLNVEIWNSSFTVLIATSKSPYNTTQELHFTVPADGEYGMRVTYADQPFGTAEAENYGLAWSATPLPEPMGIGTAATAGMLVLGHRWRRRKH